jgi:hypothetical protein
MTEVAISTIIMILVQVLGSRYHLRLHGNQNLLIQWNSEKMFRYSWDFSGSVQENSETLNSATTHIIEVGF